MAVQTTEPQVAVVVLDDALTLHSVRVRLVLIFDGDMRVFATPPIASPNEIRPHANGTHFIPNDIPIDPTLSGQPFDPALFAEQPRIGEPQVREAQAQSSWSLTPARERERERDARRG